MPQINVTYDYSEEELLIINSNQPSKSSDWRKRCFQPIKENITSHLKNEQNLICVYCQLEIPVAHSPAEIEHIAPKSKHLGFMFEPKNLALACHLCNTKKSINETLLDSTITNYPSDGNAFNMVHPHFDEYSRHIMFIDGIIVSPTPYDNGKGENTIKMCNLDREELVVERSKKIIMDEKIEREDNPVVRNFYESIINPDDEALDETVEFIDDA